MPKHGMYNCDFLGLGFFLGFLISQVSPWFEFLALALQSEKEEIVKYYIYCFI